MSSSFEKIMYWNLGIRGFFFPQFFDVYNLADFIIKVSKISDLLKGEKKNPNCFGWKTTKIFPKRKKKNDCKTLHGSAKQGKKRKRKRKWEKRERISITSNYYPGDLNLVTRFSKSEVRSLLFGAAEGSEFRQLN